MHARGMLIVCVCLSRERMGRRIVKGSERSERGTVREGTKVLCSQESIQYLRDVERNLLWGFLSPYLLQASQVASGNST